MHFAWLLREGVATKDSLKKGEVYASAVICEVATEVLAQHLRQADIGKNEERRELARETFSSGTLSTGPPPQFSKVWRWM